MTPLISLQLKDAIFARLWEYPNAHLYFDSKPHFVPFLASLNTTYGDSIASRMLFSPNAMFFDKSLSSDSTNGSNPINGSYQKTMAIIYKKKSQSSRKMNSQTLFALMKC
jgi:hypothetical protein